MVKKEGSMDATQLSNAAIESKDRMHAMNFMDLRKISAKDL